jgi:hypothetical protein
VPTEPPEEPGDPCPPPEPDPCGKDGKQKKAPATPAEQLEALRETADKGAQQLQRLEPLKTQLADVAKRITALEKIIADQPAATAAYTDFYRAAERDRSSIECAVQTIRCQLDLSDKQKKCIRDAIAAVEARVKKAQDARDAQRERVKQLERWQKKLEGDLAWATKWATYFKTTLQTQVTAQRDDLKKLMDLADPSKDQCEAWFYLDEIESLIHSARNGDGDVCYVENINLATFLDCWAPGCYSTALQYWTVKLNEAEGAVAVGAIKLAEATKLATDLDTAATEAVTKRREWVLKELKDRKCCGPLSKCP